MSSQNIDISSKNVAGKCDLKCSYNFKYSESNSTAENQEIMLSLSYDKSSVPPVIYNNAKYIVEKIILVSPSIHIFNGSPAAAELIVEHTPVQGGKNLYVGVPIKASSESSVSAKLITNVIDKVALNAPSKGNSTNLNISGFNLQNIIPRKPFFTYTTNSVDWIVYGDLDAIPLSSSTIARLQQIIKPYRIPTPGDKLFYNSKGPTTGLQVGDGIYISCQPTGSSKEETKVEYDKINYSESIDFTNILQNKTFLLILTILTGCIIFIIVFYGINTFYKFITPIKNPINPVLPQI